ncbi:N-acetyltransferase [Thecamonas trahens ATCC 50062]|uniref:RNA cytidine acetyltransferase n=1 Tax=Thecamonas trahens ATCC 50062 TaxID=461836 RepID=A0A0L0DE60_THETB|nr:N-acetyltransferase [Thecamonas trahens ATCC 50062]KNC50569.1 N-acetyltransferase [Thecamonas trahens ATCC 50062]|eukprot:XP_013762459.1 N-acetyltransferase [Thecamonas trahens ATCC 50062]
MPLKKIDSRIRTLIENGVYKGHRSMFVVVGDKNRNQIVNLHYILSKCSVKTRRKVLWCYKKDLGFSSNRRKRMREIKRKIKQGTLDPEATDPFELFISSNDIRFCYYKETTKTLGNTYGMLVLQDFEALTPNILARTIETVEGGGLVIMLLKNMASLSSLYSMTMDVHSRYRTEAYSQVVPRFNERFILSLASCPMTLVVDEELNVLPISSHIRNIKSLKEEALAEARKNGMLGKHEDDTALALSIQESAAARELKEVKISLAEEQPVGALVETARTLDQARALLVFVEAISEKTLRSTVTLTAARGRGKSAALGLAIAAAIGYGYSNIFVTSPSPENLTTLFEFVVLGLKALGFEETADFNVVASKMDDESYAAVTRINVFRDHRQTVQYILPQDSDKLGQAELVVIDEAAAIPIQHVKALLGNYLVFLASTVNGYEGTGRSLSLKLIKKLREQAAGLAAGSSATEGNEGMALGRALREITLKEPIRYGEDDAVESWLHSLLCLDVKPIPRLGARTPHPSECELYCVDRDALFSYHAGSEAFLQRMMALYVASHYKNTPNDLQLMSDAPAHRLFVLLPPVDPSSPELPEVLAVIQVCLEGRISRASVMSSLARGKRGSGDLIPWTVAQQFQDNDFASLSGARVVRIATHPEYTRMGYGSRALELLTEYYTGNLSTLAPFDPTAGDEAQNGGRGSSSTTSLLKEKVKPRKDVPPLLVPVSQRAPERLDYVGVSYGMTQGLFNFWKRGAFVPVYVRQTANEMTGEHTCIMLRPLPSAAGGSSVADNWIQQYFLDFRARFFELLSFNFKTLPPALALSVLSPPRTLDLDGLIPPLGYSELLVHFSEHDLKRLQVYALSLVDYHVVMDLIAKIARLYFLDRIPDAKLRVTQAAILLAVGAQHHTVDEVVAQLKRPSAQILALFAQGIKALEKALRAIQEAHVAEELPSATAKYADTTAAMDVGQSSERVAELLRDESLAQYTIAGRNEDWDEALGAAAGTGAVPSSVSIASTRKRKRDAAPSSAKKASVDIGTMEREAKRTKAAKAAERSKRAKRGRSKGRKKAGK